MFSTTDDDDFFNTPANSTSSNLASLFGTLTSKQKDNTSLVYTAPKNPKLNAEDLPKSLPSSVICTAFVEAYILSSDETKTNQGKCGIAVIGNQAAKSYDIILYKSKQDVIMRKKLNNDFTFILKENNFASFCDDEKRQWTVHFENFKELSNISEEIQKHGAKISRSLDKGSLLETKPSENLSSNDAASDSSSGQAKASILSRMAKMGQSILPSNTQIQTKPSITDSETDEPVKKPTVKKRHKISPNSGEAMSKSNNNFSTGSEFVVINGQVLPVAALQSTLPVMQNPIQPSVVFPNQFSINSAHLTNPSDPFNIFIAENRTHNCELRMNMSHLSSKLDTILAKIDKPSLVSENVSDLLHTISERDKEITDIKRLCEALQTQCNSLGKSNSNYHECKLQLVQQQQQIIEQNGKIQELTEELHQQMSIKDQQLASIKDLNLQLENIQLETQTDNDTSIEKLNSCVASLKNEIDHRNTKVDIFGKTLKHSMNNLYHDIMGNFQEETSYTGSQIKAVLSQKLKGVTLNIIQEFNKDFIDVAENEGTKSEDKIEAPVVPEF